MRILDVGQCGFDGPRIKRLLRDSLGAEVVQADTADDAKALLKSEDFDIVLVNRVFAADGSSGLELIKDVTPSTNAPVMLVSDREDAQETAVSLGAVRGFGKAELYDPSVLELIEQTVKKAKGA